MPGPVALVGAGEFLPGMEALDRVLLAGIARVRPRVAIVPTASAPYGEVAFRSWAEMGRSHFSRLGAEVEAVLIRSIEDGFDTGAQQAIGEADLIYLSGGKPDHLRAVMTGSPLGAALHASHDRGAVIAGCSAGAMSLAGVQVELRPRLRGWPVHWPVGSGLVPGIAVFPHYDAWPEAILALLALRAPRGITVVGIDEDTAIVGQDGVWNVHGRGRITVWRGRHRERLRRGDTFRL